jgi:hypothetical protein
MFDAEKRIYFKECWVDPKHGGIYIAQAVMECPIQTCKVQWHIGPFWEMNGRLWENYTAYEYWRNNFEALSQEGIRDLTHVL